MKTLTQFLVFIIIVFFAQSCSDFDEVNVNPNAANSDQVQVEYFINKSISDAQQDPHIAERVFVLYWKAAGRMDRINTLPIGGYNDGWTTDYYRYLSEWLNGAYTAIQIADEQLEKGTNKEYTNNLKQVARIWRAYLLSEMADNFGPTPIYGFQGVNPEFNSVQEVYHFLLTELDEATSEMDAAIQVDQTVGSKDMAYGFNFDQWVKYANSMRMRLAMRLSEVEPDTAKTHFEDAVQNSNFITEAADNFSVPEMDGWHSLTGVMTRQWNNQTLSSTMNNLMVGLGGIPTGQQVTPSLVTHIKPNNYLGVKYEQHYATMTNDPMAGFFLDGLPAKIDPRAYKEFAIPGDFDNSEFNYYPSWATTNVTTTLRDLKNDDGSIYKSLETKYAWNASAYGSWGDKGAKNEVYWWPGAVPRLVNHLRNSTSSRIFFASWESYFLIAEAAVRGWSVPMGAKGAYERGISESFAYWGVSEYLANYLASQEYNRIGTSVSWDHTAEAASRTVQYKDGYTDVLQTMNYAYPINDLYSGGKNNDALSKIITQKFIAQSPWLPLEAWSDHRRLGLPFFENPAVENPLSNMPQLTQANVMSGQVDFFPQRLKYPSNLANNVPEGYQQAVNLLGGEDNLFTPLWWAKQN